MRATERIGTRRRRRAAAGVALALTACVAAPTGGVAVAAACTVATTPGDPVRQPRFVRRIPLPETGWFASPGLVDLTGDGRPEIVVPRYSTFVVDSRGRTLGTGTATRGRVYAPGVVADLDGDGVPEVVVGGDDGTVAAYRMRDGALVGVPGWPASTCSAGQCPETRGLAAADLDGDGTREVVATTTNTASGAAQVFVFDHRGRAFAPIPNAWPRYNTLPGPTGDRDLNGVGNHGYGTFGENVGIGQLDDDPQLEVVVTFDNHQINLFNHDGTSVPASPWFTGRESSAAGRRLGWGQFIRWLSPGVEANHLHLHRGPWPDVRRQMWLQWTASPPSIGDLDGDGRAEVVGLPNAERKEPYETQGYAFMVLDGAFGDGSRSAMRHPGFARPVLTAKPAVRPPGDWYPPSGIPAPTLVNLRGDARPEIVAATPDGAVYAVGPGGRLLWRHRFASPASKTFASEVVAADLNRDGRPEVLFGLYALRPRAGRLVVLDARGRRLFTLTLPRQKPNGNGVGVAAAPSVGDIDGDGRLEVVLNSIDHGVDVYRVPGSDTNCLPWPTGRGGPARTGTAG